MDPQLSSPTSVASSPANGPDSASKQPTYTTAGTIYNPGSSQPLQPPTRRGRSFKWPAGGVHTDLALLPKSALASLSIGRVAGGSGGSSSGNVGGRFTALQQYTPLQQNYDRASNPVYDPDHVLFKMPIDAPRMRSGNTFTPMAALLSNKNHDQSGGFQESDEDEGDDDFSMDPLMNMPVKSLHNLASYPNPSQKRAQKVLLRGAKPNMPGWTREVSWQGYGADAAATSRRNASPSPSLRIASTPDEYHDTAFTPSNRPRPEKPDPAALRQAQADLWSNPNIRRPCAQRPSRLHVPRLSESDEPGFAEPAPTTLSTGPGAPRPLTAGPPGQRQYRPSTFESTFKALSTKAELQSHSKSEYDSETASHERRSKSQAGIEDAGILFGSFSSSLNFVVPAGDCPAIGQTSTGALPDDYLPPTHLPDRPESRLGPVGTAADCRVIIPAVPRGPWSQAGSERSKSSWRRSQPGRLTEEELMARNVRINNHWYAGADLLGKTTLHHIDDALQRKMQKKLGAIGDGRPSKRKGQYRPIEIEDANRMPVSEHAEWLINMLFGTILRQVQHHTDKSGFRQFDEATPEQVDNSVEGRASFFGNPSEGEAASTTKRTYR